MKGVRDLRQAAKRAYERERGSWARERLWEQLGWPKDEEDGHVAEAPSVSLGLAPPTERQVLTEGPSVREWVQGWQCYGGAGEVAWQERRWPSAGTQLIPVRVCLEGAETIAQEAGCLKEWRRLAARASELAELFIELGSVGALDGESDPDGPSLPSVVRKLAGAIADAPEADWAITLKILRWLAAHRGLACYVRELPIRGIDTKWIEGRQRLVLPLARSMLGLSELPFKKAPELLRIRALDQGILPNGFEDCSLTAPELAQLSVRPKRVVVCENLVSFLTMPAMTSTLALFGQGYGVGSRFAIPWLDSVRLIYWGDIDTHGFRILDGFRKHHPQAVSVFMDSATLKAYRDLWVEEPKPYMGALHRLTPDEMAVYDKLRQSDPVPRLEQERIPYERVRALFGSLAMSGR